MGNFTVISSLFGKRESSALLTCIPVLKGLKNPSLVVGKSRFAGNS